MHQDFSISYTSCMIQNTKNLDTYSSWKNPIPNALGHKYEVAAFHIRLHITVGMEKGVGEFSYAL